MLNVRDEFTYEAILAEADKPTGEKDVIEGPEQSSTGAAGDGESEELEHEGDDESADPAPFHLAPIATAPDNEVTTTRTTLSEIHSVLTRTSTAAYTRERFEVEQAIAAEKTKSIAIAPTKTTDGVILVDWYTTDDPANPQNWPTSKKA